jgi:hypothetical protein
MKKSSKIILSNKGDILRAIVDSKMNNTVIGIHAKILGKATYLTGIREILLQEKEEPLILLADCDITGYFLGRKTLRLSEIMNVIPFISPFQDPNLKKYGQKETFNKN